MKIKLNHMEIEVAEGEKLIEVARRHGFEIPALCYAEGFKHQSSCMVCIVKNLTTGQMVPACSTLAVEGMEIDTESDEVKALRTMSLELLLSDHIAVCKPPCDVKKCKLRQYALLYRAKWTRYTRYSAIKGAQPQQVKDNLWFDVTRCIRCGLCVYNSDNGFTFKDRGFGMQVVLPEENAGHINETLAELCPTGALYNVLTY
jgi:NADH dehydrogenase/NADH:ubiquinone oxidoreductase subunit G